MAGSVGAPTAGHPLDALLDAILDRHLAPEDPLEIAALLESMGWNDERAAAEFGTGDVFELAQEVWLRYQDRVEISFRQQPLEKTPSLGETSLDLIRQFLRGAIFALPMAISVFAMLTLGFSLWSYINTSVSVATAISIGTILSFVTVGGYMQAIARRGYYFIFQGYYNMSKRVTYYFVLLGFATSIVLSAVLFVINWFTRIYPPEMITIVVLFYFVLNSIWLSVTVMYLLKRELLFTGLVILGITLVYLFFVILHWGILISQWIGMTIVSLISIALVVYLFNAAEKREEKGINPRLPKWSVTIHSIMPYFAYGFFYFLFLFVDRIVSWSTNETYMPFFIWFRTNYELGLDFALLTLILPMGASEVILSHLMNSITFNQHRYHGSEAGAMNAMYIRNYWKFFLVMVLTGLLSAVGVYYLVMVVVNRYLVMVKYPILVAGTIEFVFLWSLLAYTLVAITLLNSVILFTLSQPGRVVRAFSIALAVNLLVGFLLTRWFDYPDAVFGLLAGSVVLLVLSTQEVLHTLNRLDYYLYALS